MSQTPAEVWYAAYLYYTPEEGLLPTALLWYQDQPLPSGVVVRSGAGYPTRAAALDWLYANEVDGLPVGGEWVEV